MFIMMTQPAAVGVQGISIAERAYQKRGLRLERKATGRRRSVSASTPIIQHPDVKRMLIDDARLPPKAAVLWPPPLPPATRVTCITIRIADAPAEPGFYESLVPLVVRATAPRCFQWEAAQRKRTKRHRQLSLVIILIVKTPT
jgi:hypothetical protein